MSGESWTPGPWFASDNPPGWDRVQIMAKRNGGACGVADVYRPPYPAGGDANVHLVAAAPDLYEALEAAARALIGERDCIYDGASLPDGTIPDGEDAAGIAEMDRVINQCRAAQAKARGETT